MQLDWRFIITNMEVINIMFVCNKCGKETAQYNNVKKWFECNNEDCRHIEHTKFTIETCSCGYQFVRHTFFDPSGCKQCKKSFVN